MKRLLIVLFVVAALLGIAVVGGDAPIDDHPVDARTVDFTFAVQQSRSVEFLVKPEVGEARIQYPNDPGR